MNFYDQIHNMIRAFKEMEEYKQYLELKSKIKADDKYGKMVADFKEKQKSHQFDFINSGKLEENHQKELENMYSLLIQSEDVRKFLELEMKLDVYLADMQKIIGEGIKEMLEF